MHFAVFFLTLFYINFLFGGEVVDLYQRLNSQYNELEEIDYDDAILFMNKNMHICYPDYSKDETGKPVDFPIIFNKNKLNYLKNTNYFPTACWQASVILRALTVTEQIRLSYEQNYYLFKNLNNFVKAGILGMVYISPPLDIMRILLTQNVKTNQGSYMIPTSKKPEKYAALISENMENLSLKEHQNKLANIWSDIIELGKNSEYLKKEPDYHSLKIEEIDEALKLHGGINCLTNANTWQIRLIEISLLSPQKIRVSLPDMAQ